MNFKNYILLVLTMLSLKLMAQPEANFECTSTNKKAFSNIYFKNTSKKSSTYAWDFGDGGKSTEMSPTHQYSAAGTYSVSLKASKGKKQSEKTMTIEIGAPEHCTVEIETPFGTMTVVLYDQTPQHRDNFLKLVGQGFYDSLLFHRVINGFMIQGGDPTSKGAAPGVHLGSGGPGYTIPAEFNSALVHTKGALAAARMSDAVNPDKRSSGSQFYIVHGRPVDPRSLSRNEAAKGFNYPKDVIEKYERLGGTPFLDMDYTVFGEVIKGLDIIDKIAAVPTQPGDRPKEDVWMKIRVVNNN
ncbi:MAG: peptidylprolyl isomerase [Saprospiraceae bacterium]|jgi:cyclophilin family peptidyl-prolyl cis-trans isomerase|nr:peptidylprolyl isomerase [Saprospiraceae bacterium]